MKMYKYFMAFAVCAALVGSGCGKHETPKPDEKHEETVKTIVLKAASIEEIKLETETVVLKPLTGYLTIPARVVTNQDNEAQIGSLVQGRVHQVFVNVGDYVKAGQVVMTLEGLDIGQIKAGFMKAKAAYEYAKANYERQKKLFEEKVGSQKSYLESQAEYEKALADFKAEDKKIHSVGLLDEDFMNTKTSDDHTAGTLPIKASISGIVIERNVVIGQLVDVSTNAFKIINTASVWVDGQIYEKDISKIAGKSSAVFNCTAYPKEKFNGTITYVGQTVDEHSRTITVRGSLNNANNRLKPQMFGELHIPVGANAKAILIPEEAVVQENGAAFVFVRVNDTSFVQRKVISGVTVDSQIEIREGIKEGDVVVTKGVFYLKSELKKDEVAGAEH